MVRLWVRKGHTVKFWTITNGSDQHDMDQKWAVCGQDETKLPAGKPMGRPARDSMRVHSLSLCKILPRNNFGFADFDRFKLSLTASFFSQ